MLVLMWTVVMRRLGVPRARISNLPTDSSNVMVMICSVEPQVDSGQYKDCDEIQQRSDSGPLAPRLSGGS